MTAMTLTEAIAEVKLWNQRGRGWPGAPRPEDVKNVIMKAIASGDLIHASEARLAVALAVQKAANHVRTAEVPMEETGEGAMQRALLHYAADVLSLSAPADDLAELNALRADRDELAEQYAKVLGRANTQGARAEAAEVEVVRLRALVEIAGNARLLIDTGFSEMGETVNYRPSLIAKVCDMLEPHAALQPTTPAEGKG